MVVTSVHGVLEQVRRQLWESLLSPLTKRVLGNLTQTIRLDSKPFYLLNIRPHLFKEYLAVVQAAWNECTRSPELLSVLLSLVPQCCDNRCVPSHPVLCLYLCG